MSYFGYLNKVSSPPKNGQRINNMATSLTTDFAIPAPRAAAALSVVRLNRRRRITPPAGHALEILGHAIEYLTDEFVHENTGMMRRNGQLEAVQLLMAANRRVYYECPEVQTIGQRLRAAFGLRTA
jgi:hypothetical protein